METKLTKSCILEQVLFRARNYKKLVKRSKKVDILMLIICVLLILNFILPLVSLVKIREEMTLQEYFNEPKIVQIMYLIVVICVFISFYLTKRTIKQAKQIPLGSIKTMIKTKEVPMNTDLGYSLFKVAKFIGWDTDLSKFREALISEVSSLDPENEASYLLEIAELEDFFSKL